MRHDASLSHRGPARWARADIRTADISQRCEAATAVLDAGDLSELVDREAEAGRAGLPERVARPLFQQLMVAVDYCHRLGVANRDVKVLPRPQRSRAVAIVP